MEKTLKEKLSKLYHQRVIIDSSVLIKAFKNEEDSVLARAILRMGDKKELSLLSTSLLAYEFINVMTRYSGEIAEINKILSRFKKIGISMLPLEAEMISKAAKYCCDDQTISFYDAAYHAMAKEMNAIFLTADEKYYNSAKSRGNIKLLSLI